MLCSFPGCQKEIVIYDRPLTWLERVADICLTPGFCWDHKVYQFIDMEVYQKAGLLKRATMEIQALEDMEFVRSLDR